MSLDLFTMSIPLTGFAEPFAERAERDGWDGITYTDSQNLIGDPFIAMALGARVTERLQFMTGVTNPATRHPAALATALATVQEVSKGRTVCGPDCAARQPVSLPGSNPDSMGCAGSSEVTSTCAKSSKFNQS